MKLSLLISVLLSSICVNATRHDTPSRLAHLRSRQLPSSSSPSSAVAPLTLRLTNIAASKQDTSTQHGQFLLQLSINQALVRYNRFVVGQPLSFVDLLERMKQRVTALLTGGDLASSSSSAGLQRRSFEAFLHTLLDRIEVVAVPSSSSSSSTSSTTSNTTAQNLASTSPSSGTSGVDASTFSSDIALATSPTAASAQLDIVGRDVGYFTTFTIGTPGLPFKILMDSSADFWIPSDSCAANCGTSHSSLGFQTSSSFVNTSKPFKVTYGTGNVVGTVVSDTVAIGPLSVQNLKFGATSFESVDFSASSVPFDGLCGTAKSSLSNQQVPTIIEALAASGTIPSASVGYHLSRSDDGTNDGEITFGGVDSSKFTGAITTFPNVSPSGFWEGKLDDITVDGKSLNLGARTAILDTGTTLVIMPPSDAVALHALIPGSASDSQGGFTLPCNTTTKVAFSFGGVAFVINSRDLVFNHLGGGVCTSGIAQGNVGTANEFLLGDVFLKSVYFTTNADDDTIGLARSISA